MSSLLSAIPKALLHDLLQGRWLPIVGTGFSKYAVVAGGNLPLTWAELGKELSADVEGLGSEAPVLEVLSAYEHGFGRVDLIDRTARLIRTHDASPGPAHIAFAKIGFTDVITTNFDYLLERAYEAVGKGCMPVVDEAQLSTPNRYAGPRVIKMHGDTNHPSRLVITEDDYDQFLQAYPLLVTSITAMFVDRTPVLVGYGLDDPDTRQLLNLIRHRLGRITRPMWTIQVALPPHVVSRYERRGVKVINLPAVRGKSVGDQLAQLFDELGQHWRDSLPHSSVSTDDRVAADLLVPGEPSRMCFFAVPLSLIGWYRDIVFPVVEQSGMVPVTARDVLTPPGTIANKLDALIERAGVVVAELGSSHCGYEASLAIARKSAASILLVVDEGRELPPHLQSYQVLRRPLKLEADPAGFAEAFATWISRSRPRCLAQSGEPERLLRHREYGAAVISAVSLLEVTLNSQLPGRSRTASGPRSVRMMLRDAVEQGFFAAETEFQVVEEAVSTRNEVLHRARTVSGRDARRYVATIRQFTARMQ